MLESRQAALVATSAVLAALTIVSVTVQLERQYKTVGGLNASKSFLVASAFFALLMTALVCAAAANGLGASISPEEFASNVTLQKLIIAALPPYFLCNMLVKHAWLTFYYGLARTRAQRYFIHFMQFVAAAFGISSVIVSLLQCIPLSHVWTADLDPQGKVESAKCINLIAFFYANASIMIANDVVMYLMPMWFLRNVDMLRPHRIGICALFCVGGLVVLASVFRLVAVYGVATSPEDLSADYALIWIWAAVENHVGICAACAGALKQRSLTAFHSVRRSYSDLRYKVSPPQSAATQTQSTEDRRVYERADSDSTAVSSDVKGDVDSKERGIRMDEGSLSKEAS